MCDYVLVARAAANWVLIILPIAPGMPSHHPKALRGSQKNLSSVPGLASLPVFPLEDQPTLRDLTVVWEKTGLLGDLALRLPDMVFVPSFSS